MILARKPLVAAAAIGVTALVALGWWLSRSPVAQRAPAAIPVRAVAVARKDVADSIRAIGTVRSQRSVVIRPQVDGELVELAVREGQQVKRGDLLARIDDRAIRAALEQARAQLDVSEAQLKSANLDLERYHRLRDEHVISAQQIDQQQAQVEQLGAAVRNNRAAIAAREVQLSYTRIFSPTDGRVGIRNFDEGSFVRATDTEGLFSVVQLDPISVEISLPQAMLPAVQQLLHDAGSKPPQVLAYDGDGGTLLGEGGLVLIDNRVSMATGTIRVKADFENRQGKLWPDQTVAVAVQSRLLRDALIVPQLAIQRGPDGDIVYRVRDEHVEIVPVHVVYSDEKIAALSGVEAGDMIVIDGQSRLRAGARVQLQAAERSAEPDDAQPIEQPAGRSES
ncbi:MAG TPA: efflux RND transporter periplasmic adaptor subunit [Steroidobacteraceae bacterium]|nr:efflux RND transporter periplasmic adaptor subunit [Steroidobacteraceae bacterium]